MATARNHSSRRTVGWLLGFMAVVNVNLNAEEALPPIVRAGNHFAVAADRSASGAAPIVDKSQFDETQSNQITPAVVDIKPPIIDKRQFNQRPSKEIGPAVFDITPPIPGTSVNYTASDDADFADRRMMSGISSDTTNVFEEAVTMPDRSVVYPVNESPGLFGSHAARRPGEIQEPTTDPRYERVVDLFEGNDRELIQRVREAVEQTEVGVDTTDERWISVRGGNRITWGGRIEPETISWVEDEQFQGAPPPPPAMVRTDPFGQQNYVEFRRLRLFAAGEGYGVFDYQLEFDFAENNVLVKDAFIGMSDLPLLGYAMIGHFRVPIGLENRTSTRFIPFMERSLPRRLLPGRDLGLAFFNQTPSQRATWSFGAFFADIDEADKQLVDDNQGTRAVARVTWTPFYDEASLGNCFLHLGAGYSYTRPRLWPPTQNEQGGRRIAFFARPEINRGDRLIDTGTLMADQYHTGNVEMAYANGPLTLQSELTWTSIENTGGGSADLYGAYAYASWFLTGERRPYNREFGVFGRVIPYENFWMVRTDHGQRSGWGAWEFALRWSYLSFADVNNQSLNDITAGMNWYWNPHTRMMLNWIHPIAHNSPFATDSTEDAHGDILALRMAIDF